MLKHEDYIDIDDGLKRIGGNMVLYKRLLATFVEGKHIMTSLVESLEKKDLNDAVHYTHTLKGMSANLSLVKISSLSAELEKQILDGQEHADDLASLQSAFDATLECIAELLNS